MGNYRKLTSNDIDLLEKNHCHCDDWGRVTVAEKFNPNRIINTEFSGDIQLGEFSEELTLWGGVSKKCGIYDAKIHNATIGNNALINGIQNYIANYEIGDNVIINNVGILAVNGVSNFGNGTAVEVLNEAGGREVLIYNEMSAQIAYMLTFYRDQPAVVDHVSKLIDHYVESNKSNIGKIGRNTRLLNTRSIRNVNIGDHAVVEDAEVLENGTILSKQSGPSKIGPGVFAKNFICQTGSNISDGSVIDTCFIGQGCEFSKQFSAENSLFFANCGCFHGEACAVFAGPYTVSHHKSTLLIAGYFSFFNAGSGSNQSNHMYKLGPCHQGILERGAKTASDSYLLYPFRIGAFSLVMGRHYKHSDLSALPFSYLIESKDESLLAPGVNLRSVGTIRDAMKWPNRDKRSDEEKFDLINFDLLSPYTVNKMIAGKATLEGLAESSGGLSEFFTYNNVKISNHSLKRGIDFYEKGIIKFLGNTLVRRLENQFFSSEKELQEILAADCETGGGDWIDMAGMVAPKATITALLQKIETQQIKSIEQLRQALRKIHDHYNEYKWTWFLEKFQEFTGKPITKTSADELVTFIQQWVKTVLELDDRYIQDCQKEFQPVIRVGYGIDGNEETEYRDFEAVRGAFESNAVVQKIHKHKIDKQAKANGIIEKLLLL